MVRIDCCVEDGLFQRVYVVFRTWMLLLLQLNLTYDAAIGVAYPAAVVSAIDYKLEPWF